MTSRTDPPYLPVSQRATYVPERKCRSHPSRCSSIPLNFFLENELVDRAFCCNATTSTQYLHTLENAPAESARMAAPTFRFVWPQRSPTRNPNTLKLSMNSTTGTFFRTVRGRRDWRRQKDNGMKRSQDSGKLAPFSVECPGLPSQIVFDSATNQIANIEDAPVGYLVVHVQAIFVPGEDS